MAWVSVRLDMNHVNVWPVGSCSSDQTAAILELVLNFSENDSVDEVWICNK